MVGASPALAAGPAPGWDGTGMSPLEVVGVFIGVPVGLFVVISLLLVYLPQWVHEIRYRPGLVWTAEPVWFNGPEAQEEALAAAEPTRSGGGASASW